MKLILNRPYESIEIWTFKYTYLSGPNAEDECYGFNASYSFSACADGNKGSWWAGADSPEIPEDPIQLIKYALGKWPDCDQILLMLPELVNNKERPFRLLINGVEMGFNVKEACAEVVRDW